MSPPIPLGTPTILPSFTTLNMISNITPSMLANFRVNMGLVREPFVKPQLVLALISGNLLMCVVPLVASYSPPRFFASFGNLCLLIAA